MEKMRASSKQRESKPNLPLRAMDAALGCCRNIETIAELLGTCAQRQGAEPLDDAHVAQAGWMIAEEARKLHGLVRSLQGNGTATGAGRTFRTRRPQ